jgi:hypothetical protein
LSARDLPDRYGSQASEKSSEAENRGQGLGAIVYRHSGVAAIEIGPSGKIKCQEVGPSASPPCVGA